ncbi:MAG: DEAD/DEAH box helicase [Candidatus Poribacteria bacterium]|nr:DEAD/DEAH box helicase [Candidatus Poribacteria bacterium]MDE0503792.1 DEAD/DEAH box helicase [Candidatus Poribacteria bacterium]
MEIYHSPDGQIGEGLQLPSELRPYQWEGVRFLVENDGVLLADEMGLGKTVQVAVSLEILRRRQQLTRALVVVPASLKLNWESELRRWAPSLSVQRVRGDSSTRRAYFLLPIIVLVASYEELRLDIMDFASEVTFDVVVLDEAQRIKNPDSKSSLACRLLNRTRSWALTGTPVENKIDDLVSIFRFVKIGALRQGLSRTEVHSRMRPHFLRRSKKDVLRDLPPIIDQELPVELEGDQLDAYLQVWHSRLQSVGGNTQDSSANLLSIITKLKQICNYDEVSGQSAKLNALLGILDSHIQTGEKTIVFSQYVETLRWLASKLTNIPLAIFHGGLDEVQRDEMVRKFRAQRGPFCLLMSLKAGGVGLNLQEASTVILFDRWWNPGIENQAVQRAHRYGRESPLHVFRFLVVDTIEERISDIIQKKQELFENYVESADFGTPPTLNNELLKHILDVPDSS